MSSISIDSCSSICSSVFMLTQIEKKLNDFQIHCDFPRVRVDQKTRHVHACQSHHERPKFARGPMEKLLAWDSLLAQRVPTSHVDHRGNRLHATHCWHERPEIRTSTNGETACMGLIVGTKDPKFARRPMEKPFAWDSLLARKTRNSTMSPMQAVSPLVDVRISGLSCQQ